MQQKIETYKQLINLGLVTKSTAFTDIAEDIEHESKKEELAKLEKEYKVYMTPQGVDGGYFTVEKKETNGNKKISQVTISLEAMQDLKSIHSIDSHAVLINMIKAQLDHEDKKNKLAEISLVPEEATPAPFGFGGSGGTASGTFINCVGSNNAFGGSNHFEGQHTKIMPAHVGEQFATWPKPVNNIKVEFEILPPQPPPPKMIPNLGDRELDIPENA